MTDVTEQAGDEGEFLKKLIGEKKINQQDLAERIQTSRVAVNQVMNGRRSITPLMALKLEGALGISARKLLENQSLSGLDRAYAENKDVIDQIRSNPIVPEGPSDQQATS